MNNLLLLLLSNNASKTIDSITKKNYDKINALIDNYELLVVANLKILNELLKNEKNKSIILYNFGQVMELFLKMILLRESILKIEEIGNSGHQISNMHKDIQERCNDLKIKGICSDIKKHAAQIKGSDGNGVNFNDYTDFRYNHKRGDLKLIFIDDIQENDKKHIKEVIECIESVMKC